VLENYIKNQDHEFRRGEQGTVIVVDASIEPTEKQDFKNRVIEPSMPGTRGDRR
jgi:hypothetical protein